MKATIIPDGDNGYDRPVTLVSVGDCYLPAGVDKNQVVHRLSTNLKGEVIACDLQAREAIRDMQTAMLGGFCGIGLVVVIILAFVFLKKI